MWIYSLDILSVQEIAKLTWFSIVIMFIFQCSVGSGVHPCRVRVTPGVFFNRDCYGLGFRCDGAEC